MGSKEACAVARAVGGWTRQWVDGLRPWKNTPD